MKKIFTLLFAACALVACSDDKDLDQVGQESADFTVAVSTFDDSNYGVYEGTFTTVDSEKRGVLELTINQNGISRASITLTTGEVVDFQSRVRVQEDTDIVNMLFDAKRGGFSFSVNADGSNPRISDVRLEGVAGIIAVAKETSRAPVNPVTGEYYCTDCGTHPELGGGAAQTFNVLFTGDGSADDTAVTTILLGTNDYGSDATNNAQTGCTPAGSVTNCVFVGTSSTIGGSSITYSGTHTYDNAIDCSQLNGTWSFDSGTYGVLTGEFFSDTQCAPPPNDLCAGATPIGCGAVVGFTTAGATDTDEPAACVETPSSAGGVWFAYTRSIGNDQDVTIELCGSSFDTKIFLYTGSCGALTCEDGNDDSCGLQSRVSFNEADLTGDIYVYATGFSTGDGSGLISVTCTPPPPPPGTCGGTTADFTGTTGAIPDNDPAGATFTATSTATGTIGVDADIDNVTLNITHTFDGDLDIQLISPAGTPLDLSLGNGGSGDDFVATEFRDGGADITLGTAPYTGTFEPQGGTFGTTFAGESVTGVWSLFVVDTAGGDVGTVDGWTISICDEAIPDPFAGPDAGKATRVEEPKLTKEEIKRLKGIE